MSTVSTSISSSRTGLWTSSRPQSGLLSANRERNRLMSSSTTRSSLNSASSVGPRPLKTSYSAYLNLNGGQSDFLDVGDPDAQDVDFLSLVPATTDLFIMRSKVEKPIPWKNIVEGCVLTQCFARVLTNYHKNTDMFSLYKMTKELVSMKEFRAQDEDGRIRTYKQSVEAVDRLKHLLYFRCKPSVKLPRLDTSIEVIDLDSYTSPREEKQSKKSKKSKHVKFDTQAEVIPTDSKGRVINGTEKPKSRFCVIL